MICARPSLLALLGLLLCGGAARATDMPPPGATSCSGCHAWRYTVATMVPTLAGQPAERILEKLQPYQSGAKPASVMTRIVKGFSPAQLAAIADWYAHIALEP